MAINKNHEFEELGGVKCAIVEKNASQERVDFLKSLLEYNGFTVIVVASPPAKVAAAPPAAPSTRKRRCIPNRCHHRHRKFYGWWYRCDLQPTNAISEDGKTKERRFVTLAYLHKKMPWPM